MLVPSLGKEDPMENNMATHSSIIAWRIPWAVEPCRLQSNSSVQISCSVMFDSLHPHGLSPQNSQHHGPQNSKNRIGNSTPRHISKEYCNLKRHWCLERQKVGGEGDDRGWDGWMASPTQWTLVWINSGSWYGQGGLACCLGAYIFSNYSIPWIYA